MLGGAAGGARSRPPTDLQQGAGRFPLYSLFPAQGGNRSALNKVTESFLSTPLSLSALGAPTPPPHSPYSSPYSPYSPYSPLPFELLACSQRLLLADKEPSKMEEAKIGKTCMPEPLCCSGDQRQLLEGIGVMQPLTIKTEQAKRTCNTCLTNSPKKVAHSEGGCSRTNPVTWLGVGQNVHVQVKREPQHVHMSELVAVKLEQASPGNKPDQPAIPSSLNNGSIPVGIAVARQRVGDAGLLAALSQKDNQRLHDIDAAQAAMTVGVANVLCDERSAPMAWPAPAPAPPAPLWQYPAQVSMESMMVGGVGVGGVGSVGSSMSTVGGYQLVREPTSGALLLLPAPPDLPHTVVWGGVPYPPAPLLLPPAPHPSHHLQLLPGELLASTATLQHTHTHSTRLVTLAPAPAPQQHATHTVDKRKPMIQPLITPHALIKIEPEPPQEKPPPQFVSEPVQQPLLTHLYYQPEFSEQACRSQATSPAAPPTPPPDAHEGPAHKDASNQTDHIDDEDDSPNHADEDEREIACVGVAHFPEESTVLQLQPLQPPPIDSAEDSSSEGLATSAVVGAVEKAIDAIERDDSMDNSSSGGSHDLVIDTTRTSPVPPPSQSTRPIVDVSGLELLSNSIEQFERTTPGASMPSIDPTPLTIDTRPTTKLNIMIKTSPKSPPRTDTEPHRRFEFPATEPTAELTKPSLDGLDILCALAEQRFMEEVEESPSTALPLTTRTFIKTEPLLSPPEIDRSSESAKKDRHRHRDDSSSERRRKRSRDREERLKHKLEKMRRHKRDKDSEGRNSCGELEASLRRVTACSCGSMTCTHSPAVPSAQALVNAMEKDMRERLQELQRQCDEKRAQLNALTPPLPALSTPPTPSTPALSPNSDRGSSKKRKVGRPRKVSSPDSTETIVAKKPKSKSSLVGYLLAKGKLKGGILCTRGEPSRDETNRTSKVRPKLKAEPILKVYSEEDETEGGLNRSASSSMESLNEVRQKNREKVDRLVRKHSRDDLPELELAIRRASASSDSDKERRRAKKRRKSLKSKERPPENSKEEPSEPQPVSRCTLTEEKLDSSPRVLTAMGGLFYAGKLSAVQAPDVYAITLDGERGNKPHILSREETLRDAILEVSPTSVSELPSGTRVCAYWSQQYRCLYPGTVALASPDPHNDKFVAVEFDDGDSGRIAIEDIRFLEPNYPIVEYENTLFTLSKRRRNTSVTEDKKAVASTSAEIKTEPPGQVQAQTEENTEEADRHRDRKKLKKHRKEKLKRLHSSEDDPNSVEYVKKKKKKHKCCEEHCKHRRHHKKHHRKHKKRHHSSCKEHSSSSGDDQHGRKSTSDYIDSNKSNEDSGDSNDRLSTLIAVEKSPDEKMKTVIKKAVLSKKSLVKNAILDFSNLGKIALKKDEDYKDNLKDSGIGLEPETPSTSVVDVPKKKTKKRTVSSTSTDSAVVGVAGGGVSKMAAFLPGGALWRWLGPPYRRTARPRHRKLFYRAIQRGEETLHVGEACVFLSTGRADRPYIGRLEALWQARGAMAVRVAWFYHPEETAGPRAPLRYPGGLFESPHTDENDVQTISHKCEVLPLAQYKERMGDDPAKYSTVYDNNDVYYLAGRYDPTQQTLTMEPDIPFADNTPA
ncbi:unnamed protein product [Parnassius mnemosyne]|uniref:BAH domain-containing protein n=1 Tax=Parnassius mnemosyne TaxID=213953 RepID=A0AAV1LNL9_9NEOP